MELLLKYCYFRQDNSDVAEVQETYNNPNVLKGIAYACWIILALSLLLIWWLWARIRLAIGILKVLYI